MKRKCLLLAIMLLAALTSGAKVYIPLEKPYPQVPAAEPKPELKSGLVYTPLWLTLIVPFYLSVILKAPFQV